MNKQTVGIIIGSTRPGRKGKIIGDWFAKVAEAQGTFEIKVLDLAEINLPFLDEAAHPAMMQYTKQHTKDWSAAVEACDAFVIVTPEYNFSVTAPVKNALDFVYNEWNYKPIGFVSYGGPAGGVRAVQMLRQIVTVLKMMPVYASVLIPSFPAQIDQSNVFKATEAQEKGAVTMLDELKQWSDALTPMRAKK